MKINIPPSVLNHFWKQEPEGTIYEFWALRFPIKAKPGDTVHFMLEGKEVAQSTVAFVEPPGKSVCDTTGKYKNRWKVFWDCKSFKDLRKE